MPMEGSTVKTFMMTPYSSGRISQDVYQDTDTNKYYLVSWQSEPITIRLGHLVKEFALPYDGGLYSFKFCLSDLVGDSINEEGLYYIKIIVKNKTGEIVSKTIEKDDSYSNGEPKLEIDFDNDTFTAFVGYVNYTAEEFTLDKPSQLSIGEISSDIVKAIGGEIPVVNRTLDCVGTTGSPRLFVGTSGTLDVFLNVFGALYGLVSRTGNINLLPLLPQQTYEAFLAPYSSDVYFDPNNHKVPCANITWVKGTFTKDGEKFNFGDADHTDYLKTDASINLGTVLMKLKFNTTPTSESLIFKIIDSSDDAKWSSLVYSPSDKGFIFKSSNGSSVKLNSIPIEADEGSKFSLLFRYQGYMTTNLTLVVNNLTFEKETSLTFEGINNGYVYFGSDGSDSSTSFKGKIIQVLLTSDPLPIGIYNFFNSEPFFEGLSPRFINTDLDSIKFSEGTSESPGEGPDGGY